MFPPKFWNFVIPIKLIQILDEEIAEIEQQIQSHMQELHSPLESIPGISFRLAAVIEAEIGDFRRFSSPDKILAFAGLSPSTYQSGKFTSQNAVMEKRGSRYLRHALFFCLTSRRQMFADFCNVFEEKT